MDTKLTRDQALETLKKYNTEPFHILHALTVEGAMRWFAKDQGFEDEEDFWGLVGLLHDVDFEMYPQEHCIKAPELLRQAGAEEELIRAVCSHGYGIMLYIKPEHQMEK
ncbi:MAG: hydrolase, partial [Clostridium sp.]|nr:hydrolase [Clostridium sp.]